MERLDQIKTIANNLKTSSAKMIKALHRVVFEQDGDRSNRKRLREFAGFSFAKDSGEYKAKISFVEANLNWADLVAVCNVLALEYSGTKKDLTQRICEALTDLDSLKDDEKSDREEDAIDSDTQIGEFSEDERRDTRRKRQVKNKDVRRPKKKNEDVQDEYEEDDESEEDESKEDEDEEDADEEDDIRNKGDEQRVNTKTKSNKFTMTFRDVEDSIRHYDGDDKYPVERWITDMEESAELFGWTDIQKLIFAKKMLKGVAKLFIQAEKGITSWKKLKKSLKEEFSYKINSAELHRLLNKRRMRKDESVQTYFLVMREIASRGDIEEEALFHYVIDGIDDSTANKSILYGAKSIRKFKEKLKIYEKMKTKTPIASKATNAVTNKKIKPKEKEETRCYNCGVLGHRSTECESKSKGVKCFNCNEFGHKAPECKKERVKKKKEEEETSTKKESVSSCDPPKGMFKTIEIRNQKLNALIDTGSQFNIINENVYKNMGSPKLYKTTLRFSGFGRNEVQPIGYFEDVIYVDDESFRVLIYVVSNDVMIMEVVIGNELLSQAELNIKQNSIIIKKLHEDMMLLPNYIVEEGKPDTVHITCHQTKEKAGNLLVDYQPQKIKSADIEMTITVNDNQKIVARPRRLPFPERKIVEEQVEQWIKEGIVEPCSSEYSSQVVVVKKRDGTPRVCVDYRALNRIVVKDRYPLPLIEDILDRLPDAKMYSSIDLKNGFFHVPVHKDDRKYTSFVTHNGQYQFLKVPFGFCNSPAVFQRFINLIFSDLTAKGIALPYIDDLIIPGANEEDAIANLKLVLQRAKDYGLAINKKKCKLLERRIEFLGHLIEDGKIYPSPDKTKAVARFPEPQSVKDVQSFLGLTGYFRKFIPCYAKFAKPLSDLLKKDTKFRFEEQEKDAFIRLKKCLSEEPVLSIYNRSYETEVHTDASQDGYGAVLLQKAPSDDQLHPVYFMSKKTTDVERKYSSYKLEALAVVEALRKFRVYLLGKHFKIVTDCSAFQQTVSKQDLTPQIARWVLFLQDFDYVIEHRSGSRMKHVDALSRHPVMNVVSHDITPKIRKAQDSDEDIQAIKRRLENTPYEDYYVRNGLLYKQVKGCDLLVVPKVMQAEIIRRAHEKGHFSVKRVEEDINQEFYIPKSREKIERCISNCLKCILVNKKAGKREGFLHPLTKEVPLHTYHIDHLGPLESTSKKYKHILAVIDAFTKFVWMYPVKSTTSREVIDKLELQKSIFGSPSYIVSDRGTAFTSNEFEDYCRKEDIEHLKITVGLPRANGQIERMNRTIIPVLAKMSIEEPSKWYKYVPRLQQILNSTYQRSINTTPFKLLTGVKMKTQDDVRMKEILEQELIHDFEDSRQQLRNEAKKQIVKVQQENRKHYNLRRKDPQKYKVNDLVAIKRTQLGPALKLKSNYLGPYRITKVKSNDTYDVLKEGDQEGPIRTTTCAEYLKAWEGCEDYIASSGADELSEGPNCGADGSTEQTFIFDTETAEGEGALENTTRPGRPKR